MVDGQPIGVTSSGNFSPVLEHGIALAFLPPTIHIGREKLSDKGTTSANKRVDPVRSQTGLPREQVIEAFKAHFQSRYTTIDSALRGDELARAYELVETKFGTPEWTARVP